MTTKQNLQCYESTRRLRFLFSIDNINYRFLWFEFKDNNLFWGHLLKGNTVQNPSH